MTQIEPCRDIAQLREYIDTHWRKGHILARDAKMFDFQYRTPWVDRKMWPGGTSVLCIYDGPKLLGFLGSIVAPYPRPRSYWLALWHVLPELKGGGVGGKLLQQMQDIAASQDGWIGTFGAGPEALPVYLKRGYACRAVRRWMYQPGGAGASLPRAAARHSAESVPEQAWLDYRFRDHPIFKYEIREGGIFRTETNAWGTVSHVVRLGEHWAGDVREVYGRDMGRAKEAGTKHLMDCWSFDCPGPGWSLAADDVPSVFHPPENRGNVIYATARPFLPTLVQKGDCDQDRPN